MTKRTLTTLIFLLAVVPLAGIGLAVLIAGWVLVATLAITPLVVPALVAFRVAVGGVARLDAELANALLGTSAQPPVTSPGPGGFWRRGLNVLRDAAFWRQQAYLLVRLSVGFGIAVAEWALIAASLGLVAMPIWYRWTNFRLFGEWPVDTLGRALVCVPVGIAGLAVALALIRPIAAGWRFLVRTLLGDMGSGTTDLRPALKVHALAYGVLIVFLTVVWAVTSRGYFWPEWPMIALGLPLAIHAWMAVPARSLAKNAGIAASIAVFFTFVWAVTSRGYFWPRWPIIVLALTFGVRAIVELTRRGDRISVLETTRAGAVDQQESELRAHRARPARRRAGAARRARHEPRHGRAEARLRSGGSAGAARRGAAGNTRGAPGAAQPRARDPPARARRPRPRGRDRGDRRPHSRCASTSPSTCRGGRRARSRRPPTSSSPRRSRTRASTRTPSMSRSTCTRTAATLVAEVVDDGVGGAIANGSGLAGSPRRVEALDGTLEVISPAGGPTTIRAVIPCES